MPCQLQNRTSLNSLSILLARNLREEAVVVLDQDSLPSNQDRRLFADVGSQKEWPDDPSPNHTLVFFHLELLRISHSTDLHLTQVSLPSIFPSLIRSPVYLSWQQQSVHLEGKNLKTPVSSVQLLQKVRKGSIIPELSYSALGRVGWLP